MPERQRAFQAFGGDVMGYGGNGVLGKTEREIKKLLGNITSGAYLFITKHGHPFPYMYIGIPGLIYD